MMTGDKMIREDGKEFVITTVAYWSTITAADGETASVKWYGGDDFVSSQGAGFTHQVSTDTRRKRFALLDKTVDVAASRALCTKVAPFNPISPNTGEVLHDLEDLREEVEALLGKIDVAISGCKEVDG